eukprot:7956061-Alexandrium_andersonii.AAC.1
MARLDLHTAQRVQRRWDVKLRAPPEQLCFEALASVAQALQGIEHLLPIPPPSEALFGTFA